MDRPSLRYGTLSVLLLAAFAVAAAGGCNVLATMLYTVRGNEIEAEYKGLKGKTVAVVCRPLATIQYGQSHVAKELARNVAGLLRQKVAKIEVIDQQKVEDWTDKHDWNSYAEIGKALKADMVVGIDLESFSTRQSQTIYQGKADLRLQVYDCASGNKLAFEKALPQSLYPPNIGIPSSDKPEGVFRREYLAVLADQIGRHFYPHDAYADYALDAAAGL